MKNEKAQKSLFGRMADTAARWAANMMQCAGEEVRCYEEACQKLGSESAPYEKARNARLDRTGSLYDAYFPELGEVL